MIAYLTDPFQYPFMQRALAEVLLLSIPAGLLGSWIVLRLRPDETIEIDAVAKKAGLGLQTERIGFEMSRR